MLFLILLERVENAWSENHRTLSKACTEKVYYGWDHYNADAYYKSFPCKEAIFMPLRNSERQALSLWHKEAGEASLYLDQ